MKQAVSLNNLQSALTQYKDKTDKQMQDYIDKLEVTAYKEISNPLTTTEISQESPIGSIIAYIGSTVPKHYLMCDGSEYNISDYPFLAEFFLKEFGVYNIFGGNGVTTFAIPKKDISIQHIGLIPIMISNTTPSGKAIGNSLMNGYDYYQSFNDNLDSAWTSKSNACFLEYDFDVPTVVTAYSVQTRNFITETNINDLATAPKTWTFEGSQDGVDWKVLDVQTGITWSSRGQEQTFVITNNEAYLKYRINITANSDFNGATSIGRLQFYSGEITYFNCIKYEPTYYAVNQYGGFESTVLWEGNANTIGEFKLIDNIKNYNYLLVEILNEFTEQLIDITPIMTSNTAPSPYVASASNEYHSSYSAWKAFNGTVNDSSDCWYCSNTAGWIQIDFGDIVTIDSLKMTSANRNDVLTSTPNTFVIQGSQDGVLFDDIQTFSKQTWEVAESKTYTLGNKVSYRYFRINVTVNNGGTRTVIGDIRFFNNVERLILGNDKLIYNSDILYKTYIINERYNDSYYSKIHFYLSINSLHIYDIVSTFSNSCVSRIIGIRGQLPSLMQGGIF